MAIERYNGTGHYVIAATKNGDDGYISISHRSGGIPAVVEIYNADMFSYDSAVDYYNELTTGCFKNLGIENCEIYEVALEPIEYTKYDD